MTRLSPNLKRQTKRGVRYCVLGFVTSAVVLLGLKIGLVQVPLYWAGLPYEAEVSYSPTDPCFKVIGDPSDSLRILVTRPGWASRSVNVVDSTRDWAGYVRSLEVLGHADVPAWAKVNSQMQRSGWYSSELDGFPFGTLIRHYWLKTFDEYLELEQPTLSNGNGPSDEEVNQTYAFWLRHRLGYGNPVLHSKYAIYVPGTLANTLVYAVLWYGGVRLWRSLMWLRRRRRIRHNKCGSCAYPVDKGTMDVCPECGTSVDG